MRVLIVGPHLEVPGGVSNYYKLAIPRLERSAGIDVLYFRVGQRIPPDRFHVINDHLRLCATIKRFKPDVVHINPSLSYRSFFRDAFILRAAKKADCKVLVFFRGWTPGFADIIDGPLRRVFLSAYGKADGFVVLAEKFEKKLRSWGITAPIFIGTTIVDERVIDERIIMERLEGKCNESKKDPIKFLFMSRLEPKKGAVEAINAVKLLRDNDYPAFLTIAGTGSSEPMIQSLLENNQSLRAFVKCTGHVSGNEKFALLFENDVFCFPSRHGEGMPTAVLEAMAFGMPVVTTQVGGLSDFFIQGKMGLFVDGSDIKSISSSLEFFAKDRRRIFEVGSFNYSYAKENFYAESTVGFLTRIYGEIVFGKEILKESRG